MNTDKQESADKIVGSTVELGACGHFCEACARRDDEIKRLHTLAMDASDAWDNDRDMVVGKLLLAMLNKKFCAAYRPDLTPNAVLSGAATQQPKRHGVSPRPPRTRS